MMNSAKFVEVEFDGQKYVAVKDGNDRMSVCAVGHIQAAAMAFRVRALVAAAKYHADFPVGRRHIDTCNLDEVWLSPALHAAIKFHNASLFPLGSPEIRAMTSAEVAEIQIDARAILSSGEK